MEFLPLVGIVLLFWLFIIRPQSRRQKEMRSMQAAVSIGDEIVLTSGVYGTVRELGDDDVHVEIAPGVTIKVARGAIGTVRREPEPDAPASSEPAATDHPDAVADRAEEN